MDKSLSTYSKEDLLEEIKRREAEGATEMVIAFGVIAEYDGIPCIERFVKVKSPQDLPNMQAISLRSRYNIHRKMKGFFFKTEIFEEFKESLNEDNEKFAKWVMDSPSINFMEL